MVLSRAENAVLGQALFELGIPLADHGIDTDAELALFRQLPVEIDCPERSPGVVNAGDALGEAFP